MAKEDLESILLRTRQALGKFADATEKASQRFSGFLQTFGTKAGNLISKKITALPGMADNTLKSLGKGIRKGIQGFPEMAKNVGTGRKEVTGKVKGAAGNLPDYAKGVLLNILTELSLEGIQRAGNAIVDANASKPLQDQADLYGANVQETEKLAAANDRQRQSESDALKQLQALSSEEMLSCEQKSEALKLIEQLKKSYAGLGVSIDETTGRITGLDDAMREVGKKQHKEELADIDRQLKEMRAQRDAYNKIIDADSYWNNVLSGGRTSENAMKAAEMQTALVKQMMALQKKRNELRKKDPETEFDNRKRQMEKKAFHARNYDRAHGVEDAIAKAEASGNYSDPEIAEMKRNAAAYTGKHAASTPEAEAAYRNLDRAMTDAGLGAMARTGEKEKTFQGSADQVSRKTAREEEKANAFLKRERFNNQYQDLLNRGLTEEAERLKFINELEQQGIRLSKEKVDAVLAERKSIRQATPRRTEQGGRTEREKAVREAESIKGSALTRQEKARVTGLADLTWERDSRNAPAPGDLSIRTGSLTSRGGFATGAATPDRDTVGRQIAEYHKKTNELLEKITKTIADIGKF